MQITKPPPKPSTPAMQEALFAEIGAITAMVPIAPTTRPGLQAFASYLREDRQHQVGMQVEQVLAVDGYTSNMYVPRGSEKPIAQRAAELG